MFVVYRYYDYNNDEPIYKKTSLIAIYDYMEEAKKDLIEKLIKLKYEFEIYEDSDTSFELDITKKNGIDHQINKITKYEIIKFKTSVNTIKL